MNRRNSGYGCCGLPLICRQHLWSRDMETTKHININVTVRHEDRKNVKLLLLMSNTPETSSSGSPVDTNCSLKAVIIISGHRGWRVRTMTVGWPAHRCSAAGEHAAALHWASASTPLMRKKRQTQTMNGELSHSLLLISPSEDTTGNKPIASS